MVKLCIELYSEIILTNADHYGYLHQRSIGEMPFRISKEQALPLEQYGKLWEERARSFIGDLPHTFDDKLFGTLTPKQFRFCPPRVLGFAISKKQFVQLLVNNIGNKVSTAEKKGP